jgi:hypothetical protein
LSEESNAKSKERDDVQAVQQSGKKRRAERRLKRKKMVTKSAAKK